METGHILLRKALAFLPRHYPIFGVYDCLLSRAGYLSAVNAVRLLTTSHPPSHGMANQQIIGSRQCKGEEDTQKKKLTTQRRCENEIEIDLMMISLLYFWPTLHQQALKKMFHLILVHCHLHKNGEGDFDLSVAIPSFLHLLFRRLSERISRAWV